MTDATLLIWISGALLVTVAGLLLRERRVRLRLERDLQALSTDLSLTENVSGIGYWKYDVGSATSVWSTGLFQIHEQDPTQFVPSLESMSALYSPDDLAAIGALMDPAATDSKGGQIEAHIRFPNGNIKDVLVAVRFRRKANGNVAGFFGIVADITARKRAERTITEREDQFQHAISAMGAGVWDLDVPAGRLFAGPRFAEIVGHKYDDTAPELQLQQYNELTHPEDLPKVRKAFADHIANKTLYDIEYRIRHSAGHYVWVHCRGRVVSYQGDRPLRIIGTVEDATARRAAADDLRRSRETLELVIQASHAGYLDVSTDTGLTTWSPRAREILGITGPDFWPTDSHLAQLVHPDDLSEFYAELETLRSRGTAMDVDLRVRHGDGRYVWVHLRAVPEVNADGKPTRTIAFFRDISVKKNAQAALVESERKFRDLIGGSLQGVVIVRVNKALFCNTAYARMLGYERVEGSMRCRH